jgi:ureidoglycolate lyase
MMIAPQPLTQQDFAPFGDVLEVGGAARTINAGMCLRYHDRAKVEVEQGRVGISLFHAQLRALPYHFDLIERHPLGSQAFIPMGAEPFLVIVARDTSTAPLAFLTNGAQGINFHRGTWHGVLTPLAGSGMFAVIDRIGEGANLEEFRHPTGWTVTPN